MNRKEISFENLVGINGESLQLDQEISKDNFNLIELKVKEYENKIVAEEKDARERLKKINTTDIVSEGERKRVQEKINEVAEFKKDNPTKIKTTFENLIGIDNNSLNLDSKINRDNFEKIKALVNNNSATVKSIKRYEKARKARKGEAIKKTEIHSKNGTKPAKRPKSAPLERPPPKIFKQIKIY